MIPSENAPLVATDFYQVLDTSDVPPGVVNIITGSRPELAKELARHDNVDGLWCAGHHEMATEVERLSSGNLKQTWVVSRKRDWGDPNLSQGRPFLRWATQVKNIWPPYGEQILHGAFCLCTYRTQRSKVNHEELFLVLIGRNLECHQQRTTQLWVVGNGTHKKRRTIRRTWQIRESRW